MTQTRRIIISGPFKAQELARGAWRLTAAGTPRQVLLQGAELDPIKVAHILAARELALEWRADRVDVTVTSEVGRRSFQAAAASIHEPRPALYDALPLAGFDAAARRFWRRVFRLVRIPGGRYVLSRLARRRHS